MANIRLAMASLLLLLLSLLFGCAAAPVKQVSTIPPIDIPPGQYAKPIQFKKIVVKLSRGTQIGVIQRGPFCLGRAPLVWQGGRLTLSGDDFSDAFRQELGKSNYPVVGNPDALFDDPSEWKAEILVAGMVKELEANVCYPLAGFGDYTNAKGSAYLRVDWQIYSRLERKVVYVTTTEGSKTVDTAGPSAGTDIFVDAFVVAVQNLLADRGFHDLVVTARAKAPEKTFEKLEIKELLPFKEPITSHVNDVRGAVVTVFAGDGHGSGFFISTDGLLMTDAHVVGGAKFVKIKLVTGREVLGEVVRLDNRRDVALIKVEETGMIALPIRNTEANIGDEVYALGSPLQESFNNTMSKGIVSSYRVENETKLIQSDVNVLSGSSGGPLVDANGNVVGLSVSGIFIAGAPTGLNFFIPINDAFSQLNIQPVSR